MTTRTIVTSGQDYEYRGLMAELWDFFRGDTSGWSDRFFFRDLIREYGQPVLDVGCGTGRLLLDYLSQGVDVEGVDNSPEMLKLLKQKAAGMGVTPVVYRQAMDALDLPRRYRVMIVPSSSFQLLTDEAQARQAMARFFAHLVPGGGVLAMPFMLLWKEGDPRETDWDLIREEHRPDDGATARRWSRAWYDVENRLEHTEDRYEVRVDDQVTASEHHRRSPATTWYTQAQAVALYEAAGFVDIRVFKEFSFEPAGEADTLFSVVGVRPDGMPS
jgi:SAM-dependent methyltransferase